MNFNKNSKQQGFTIVELLIVIVVIGILAAITIVAYNGIQSRGKTASAQSAAVSLDKKIESYNAINSQYPNVAGTITGSGTQNSVTTTTSSDWYSAPTGTATQATALPTAAPANPNMLWYFPSTTVGGCVYYWDYAAAKVVPITAGSPATACPTTITTTSVPATTTLATAV